MAKFHTLSAVPLFCEGRKKFATDTDVQCLIYANAKADLARHFDVMFFAKLCIASVN